MNKIRLIIVISFLITYNNCISQIKLDSITIKKSIELKGVIFDANKKTPLPYTNIAVVNKNIGTISNQDGQFSINISNLDKNDTISFLYIGYNKKNICINKLDSFSIIYLHENTFNISDVFVFGDNPNPKQIIKKVIKNKDANYKTQTNKSKIFYRERYNIDFNKIKLIFKKSSFDNLNKKTIKYIEKNIPKHSTSYTDFLGYLYLSKNKDGKIILKNKPIKIVSLKEKKIDDFKKLKKYFDKLFLETKKNEFWKVKSGIFSNKIELKEKNDSIKEVRKNNKSPLIYNYKLNKQLKYSKLENKKEWEFLHQTSKYDYTLIGGTNINNEDVYIIDFTPTWRGLYKGRVYISMKTFALIKADYEYAKGKTGRNIQILGIGYSKNIFKVSILFEKQDNTYNLKYFSKETGAKQNVDRKLSLLKKRKRFLINKKLKEIKGTVKYSLQSKESFEMLFIDKNKISNKQFTDFKQKKQVKVIYVDQFNDNLWKGFSIIEPTKQMREYKKRIE